MNRSNLASLVALSLAPAALAQPAINWFTIDGGGGTSTGGGFTLSGTIGQHDAGQPMTGGGFTLTGGFWPAFVVNQCGPSDVAGQGQTIGADGVLGADDIIIFINWFFAADTRADIAGQGQTVGADGNYTADDIILFINRFFAGCP
jgi:hypothetical protein